MKLHLQRLLGAAAILALVACNSSEMNGGAKEERKDGKKKRTEGDASSPSSSGDTNSDASEPQIVTGAYLACIQDDQATTKSDETAYGCGVFDPATDKKIDAGDRPLKLSATTTASAPVTSHFSPDPDSSPFHAHIFLSTADSNTGVLINGQLEGSSRNFQTRTVVLNTIDDGFKLIERYTSAELSAWCGVATLLPSSDGFHRSLVKGSACGADYIYNNTGNPIVKALSEDAYKISKILGKNQGANAGVCERPGITANRDISLKRCESK